jgi:uncharacterized membrane protein YqhA
VIDVFIVADVLSLWLFGLYYWHITPIDHAIGMSMAIACWRRL